MVSRDGRGDASVRLAARPPVRQTGSCFPTLDGAREFLKYQPFALAVNGAAGHRHLRIAEVQRDEAAWRETPVTLAEARFALFDRLGQTDQAHFELATRVEPMDYVWKLGRREALLGNALGEDVDVPTGVARPA